MIEKEKTTFFG